MSALAIWESCDVESPDFEIQPYYEDTRFAIGSLDADWSDDPDRTQNASTSVVAIEPHLDYQAVVNAIRQSRRILELHDDWDGEGSRGYDVATWERATGFLLLQAKTARDYLRARFPAPLIAPAGDGSIDLFWRGEKGTLLINVPAALSESATYFGEMPAGDTAAGQLSTSSARPDLTLWASHLR